MTHAGLSRPNRKLVLVLLASLWIVDAATGQSAVVRVTTRSGIEFSVPATFHDVARPPGLPDDFERMLVDTQGTYLELAVMGFTADPGGFRARLPDVSGPLPARFARNFAAGMMDRMRAELHQPDAPYDFVPLEFDKERTAFSLRIVLTLMSPARTMLLENDSSAFWVKVREQGVDVTSLRCLLEQFQDGAPSHGATSLESRDTLVAAHCAIPVNMVREFHDELADPALFSPQVVVVRVAGFVTSTGLTSVRVMGTESRLADIEAAASLVWTSAGMPTTMSQVPVVASALADSLTWTERRISEDIAVQLPADWVDEAPAARDSMEAARNQKLDRIADTTLRAAIRKMVYLLQVHEATTDARRALFYVRPEPGLAREDLDLATDAEVAEGHAAYCEGLRAGLGQIGFRLVQCDSALREQGAGRSIVVTRYVTWKVTTGYVVAWQAQYPGKDVRYIYTISVPQADESAYRPVAERMWRGVTIKD